VLALRWSDVHFSQRSVTIERSITERMEFKAPKNDRSRIISMPETLCEILGRTEQRKPRNGLRSVPPIRMTDWSSPSGGTPINPWSFGRAVLDCVARAG